MASVIVKPLIYGSLLATKVTLRFPSSICKSRGSDGNEDGKKTDSVDSGASSTADADNRKKARSSSRRGSRTRITQEQQTELGDQIITDHPISEDCTDLNILINCGWSHEFNRESLEFLKRNIVDVDIIATTDGDFHHLGALPVLYSWLCGQRCEKDMPPVLFTEGSYKFARASLVDVLENATFSYKFDEYSIGDLEYLYNACSKLRYHESFIFTKKSHKNLTIQIALSPVNNGVSIGGAVWKITVGSRNIICAPNYCVQSAWYLNGCDVRSICKPDIFVTCDQPRIDEADESKFSYAYACDTMRGIISTVAGTLRSRGSVLIPMDVGSSIIDLLLHLNTVWLNSELQQYPIVLVSPIAVNLVLLFATCLEYMRAGFCRSFLRTLWNPIFNMRCIHPVSTLEELRKFTSMPCVFITTCSSLSFGVTSYLFAALSSYERNSVIFTSDSADIRSLIHQFEEAQSGDADGAFSHDFTLRLNLEPPEDHHVNAANNTGNTDDRTALVGDPDDADTVMNTFDGDISGDFLHGGGRNRNFGMVNGHPTYVAPKIIRDDIDANDCAVSGDLAYGIPYVAVSRADLEQSSRAKASDMIIDDQQDDDSDTMDTFAHPVQNPFEEYHRKHLEGSVMNALMFDGGSPNAEAMAATATATATITTTTTTKDDGKTDMRLVAKHLPLMIKCGLYVTRYFQQNSLRSELASLLSEIKPRRIAVLPRSTNFDRLYEIERLVRSTIEGCVDYYGYTSMKSTGGDVTDNSSNVTFDQTLSIPLDMRHEVVNRSTTLVVSLQKLYLAASIVTQVISASIKKDVIMNPRLEKLMDILQSIDKWKTYHNPQRLYQVVVNIEQSVDYGGSEAETALKCFSFWTERPLQVPCLSLSNRYHSENVEDMTSEIKTENELDTPSDVDSTTFTQAAAVKRSLDRSLLTGPVNVPTFVHFMGQCLPETTSLGGGVVNMNGRLHVSKSVERYGVNRWNVRGTLDPAFYFSRKMLRRLHNRIDPLY